MDSIFSAEKQKPASYAPRVTELEEWKGITTSIASPKTAARMRKLAFASTYTCSGEKLSYASKETSRTAAVVSNRHSRAAGDQ
jgi:hypothetical protein